MNNKLTEIKTAYMRALNEINSLTKIAKEYREMIDGLKLMSPFTYMNVTHYVMNDAPCKSKSAICGTHVGNIPIYSGRTVDCQKCIDIELFKVNNIADAVEAMILGKRI